MTCHPAKVGKAGEVWIEYKDKDGLTVPFLIAYDAGQMEAAVEKVRLGTESDEAVLANWGDSVYRINFTAKAPKTKDIYTFIIKKKS
jgi:hypothetical protein